MCQQYAAALQSHLLTVDTCTIPNTIFIITHTINAIIIIPWYDVPAVNTNVMQCYTGHDVYNSSGWLCVDSMVQNLNRCFSIQKDCSTRPLVLQRAELNPSLAGEFGLRKVPLEMSGMGTQSPQGVCHYVDLKINQNDHHILSNIDTRNI